MIYETLKETQSAPIEVHPCADRVSETGLSVSDSANLGVRRLAKARMQRMRRRSLRSALSGRGPTGWVARML